MVKKNKTEIIRYIDLFAGMGGFRLGFESAAKSLGYNAECVFTSEVKESAIEVYSSNFESIGKIDITTVASDEIPAFDFLLAGFPCQAFSSAGKREGFLDTRGTLFFEIERILREHQPKGFILENVEGLVNHDKNDKTRPIGQTLETILSTLSSIGYKVTWKVLNSAEFGLAQERRRIFIVGALDDAVSLENFEKIHSPLSCFLETGLPLEKSRTIELLLKNYSLDQLIGKSLKDKRGGSNNIHSWDISLKGATSRIQRELLTELLKARRNKKWGERKGIQWMDGMPLTSDEIRSFFPHQNLEQLLNDLVKKGYLTFEHPKDLMTVNVGGVVKTIRKYREDLPKGYNIVAGKLSFEISKILDPNGLAPTLVATDLDRMVIADNGGLRRLSNKELLRLFGFPDDFKIEVKRADLVDLFGNTVPVNLVHHVGFRLINSVFNGVRYPTTTKSISNQLELF